MRNAREGTVRFASLSAGATKAVSGSVMKPAARGESVTKGWFGEGGGSGFVDILE